MGPQSVFIAVSPNGENVYVTNLGLGSVGFISQYSVDALTGGLAPKSPPTVASGTEPVGVALTPDGGSVYATNPLDSTVSQYDVDPVNGTLTPKAPGIVAGMLVGQAIAVAPDGKSAYVSCGEGVCQYDIDPSTGALAAKTPGSVAASFAPIPFRARSSRGSDGSRGSGADP